MNQFLSLLAGLFVLSQATCLSMGCQTPEDRFITIMNSPAVQSTLESWAAEGEVINPEVRGEFGTFVSFTVDGVTSRYNISGDADAGSDPDKYAKFVEIAKANGIVIPQGMTSQQFILYVVDILRQGAADDAVDAEKEKEDASGALLLEGG